MSPIRKDDDYRATEIEDWDSWIEEQIQESQARGEFDNLPGAGKPLELYRTEVNPEYDLAFSRLRNAGVMPAWMELDREVSRMSRDLDAFLERSATWLLAERDALRASRQPPEGGASGQLVKRPWWQFWRRFLDWFRSDPVGAASPPDHQSPGDLLRTRDHIRRQYLERAAELDKKIETYHNSLPQALSHLQRLRMLPDRAAKKFDTRLPGSVLLAADTDDAIAGG